MKDKTAPTRHTLMIEALQKRHPNVQTSGFFRALATCGDYMADLLKNDPDWRARVNMVPDAYAIDHEGRHIAVFEIVDTHDVSAWKVAAIAEIGWAVDQDCFDIALIRIDKHGATLIDPVSEITRLCEVKA